MGGIFVSREAALDYAEDACGMIPGASLRFARHPVRSLLRMHMGKAA